jgi:ABC-type Fe3+/spermidine/putrescine transport system ATPase subunit
VLRRNLRKQYVSFQGSPGRRARRHFHIAEGELFTLLGPSGRKTTTLRAIAAWNPDTGASDQRNRDVQFGQAERGAL